MNSIAASLNIPQSNCLFDNSPSHYRPVIGFRHAGADEAPRRPQYQPPRSAHGRSSGPPAGLAGATASRIGYYTATATVTFLGISLVTREAAASGFARAEALDGTTILEFGAGSHHERCAGLNRLGDIRELTRTVDGALNPGFTGRFRASLTQPTLGKLAQFLTWSEAVAVAPAGLGRFLEEQRKGGSWLQSLGVLRNRWIHPKDESPEQVLEAVAEHIRQMPPYLSGPVIVPAGSGDAEWRDDGQPVSLSPYYARLSRSGDTWLDPA